MLRTAIHLPAQWNDEKEIVQRQEDWALYWLIAPTYSLLSDLVSSSSYLLIIAS